MRHEGGFPSLVFCQRSHASSFTVTATPGRGEKSTPFEGGGEGVMAGGNIARLEVDVFGVFSGCFVFQQSDT